MILSYAHSITGDVICQADCFWMWRRVARGKWGSWVNGFCFLKFRIRDDGFLSRQDKKTLSGVCPRFVFSVCQGWHYCSINSNALQPAAELTLIGAKIFDRIAELLLLKIPYGKRNYKACARENIKGVKSTLDPCSIQISWLQCSFWLAYPLSCQVLSLC